MHSTSKQLSLLGNIFFFLNGYVYSVFKVSNLESTGLNLCVHCIEKFAEKLVCPPMLDFSSIDMINNRARYNPIDAKYQQMAFRSVRTNPYLESLVKLNWCKFRGLCLHSTSVVILPNMPPKIYERFMIKLD